MVYENFEGYCLLFRYVFALLWNIKMNRTLKLIDKKTPVTSVYIYIHFKEQWVSSCIRSEIPNKHKTNLENIIENSVPLLHNTLNQSS